MSPENTVKANPLDHLAPRPEFVLRVDAHAGTLAVDHKGNQLASVPLSLQTIHALHDSIESNLLIDGLSLHISAKSLASPLGFESLLQTIMMNMVSCVFPRYSGWSPLRQRLQLHHIDVETNYIRNASFFNNINHVHILKNSLAGLPMIVALPGPSLDMDYIREQRKTCVLMAAGRAAKALLQEGIYPDYIYIQDVQTFAWDYNFGFLGDTRIPSTLIANPLGRIWKYFKNFTRVFKGWNLYAFERDGFPKIEEIAPSTVSGAYSLARLMGCDPIVFVGNDCGTCMERPDESRLPQSLTNLDFERQGNDLVFSPTSYERDLRLFFGDEISVTTKNDYLAGAQWLKIRAERDVAQTGVQIYDRSTTRLSQFHSPIEDGSSYIPSGTVTLPEAPRYETRYDLQKYLLHKKRTYEFILRSLDSGRVPQTALRKPCSTVFSGTSMAHTDSAEPCAEDLQGAKVNAGALIEHAELALNDLG
ncbi:MAG: DUF115 domain-containing protein [Pseudodesulfovibrio sp.]|nr:DUF115 domain-containing protein [Pseudodesulfovibrio sp.]